MSQPQASPGRGRTALWAVVVVAVVVLVGLLVWGLSRGTGPVPTRPPEEPVTTQQTTEPADDVSEPTDETTEPTDETTEPTDETTEPTDEATEPTDDWGAVVPPNVDSLRDFSSPNLPETIGTFVQETDGLIEGPASTSVNYQDDTVFRTVGVVIAMGRDDYTNKVAEMAEPQVIGNAVCGVTNDGIGDLYNCVVAGEPATLAAGTADVGQMSLEELAEFTNTLYDQL